MIGKTNSQTGGSIKGEKLNISLTTNQSSHSDLMGAVITVTHPGGATNYTWEGYEITVDVPPYVDYSVAYSAVNGYKTPDTFTSTAVADNSRTITGTYQTEIVSVTASADDSASVNGVTITINGTEHTYSGSAITQKVPFGTQYSVSASDKTNYATPATQTFTAGQVSRSVSMVYTASKLTVNIASNQTNDTTISAVKATVAYGSISVQVSNGETIGIPVNTDVTVTYPAVTGYKTPDVVTVNNTGGTKTASGTYYTEVVTVTLSADNSADVSGQVVTINGTDYTWAGSAISVKIPYDTTYTVSVSDKDGYTTPASQTFTASQSGRNLSLQYVYNPAKDLSMFDIYGNRISQTTANCYVVSEAGYYKFPLVYGNALKNGAANTAAYTNNGASASHDFVDYNGTVITTPYIEELSGTAASVQLSITDTDAIFTDISLVDGVGCRYIQFKVASVPATGANGVVSVKDSSGVIMWSWHIWVWNYDLTPVAITNSTDVTYNILPVNLATKLDEGTVYGSGTTGYKNWFYQWGRPTPLLGPDAYNSTTNATSYGTLSFATASYASAFKLGIQNPATYYKLNQIGSYNWFGSSSYYNLWDANCTSAGNSDNIVVKTVYDPCPIGFHIPNGNTFTYFSKSRVVGSFANGYRFKRNSSDTTGVFFPASGYLSGTLSSVGSVGYVWLSSAYSQTHTYRLTFHSDTVTPQSFDGARAYGFSVRPVQEDYYGESKITTIRIDQTITDPASMITRIVSQGGVEAIRANSHRYIGMVSDGVMQLMQLSDTDGTKFVDGTDASVYLGGMTSLPLASSGTGNVADVWMKLPQFYWKCEQYATDIWDFTVAYGMKPDDTYKTWDGKDLIGVYEAYYDGSVDWLTSVSGVNSTDLVSQSAFKTYARNKGEGYTLVKWKHHCMMAMLFYTYYGTTNSQGVCGSGTNSYSKTTGATNSLGMTDTTTANGNSMSINFWGLENWWGNKYEWIDNVKVNARVWTITEDDGTTRTAGTGGSSDEWITKLLLGENIDMIPTSVGASASTGYCDYYYQSSSLSRVVLRSSNNSFTSGGVACANAYDGSSVTYSGHGSRLAFRGDYVIV